MDNKCHIRSSNIEFLRIISMIMILSLHSFTWNRATGNDGHIHNLSIGVLFDYYRESLCICAVNIFILISGYFGIRWKLKSILNFIFQVYFWALGIYVLLVVLGKTNYSNNVFFQRLNCLIGDWWFVEAYLGLYLLAPLLNAFVDKVKKKKLLIWVIIFIIFEIYSELMGSKRNFDRGYNTLAFCGIYMTGRLLFLYQDKLQEFKHRTFSYIFFLLYLLTAMIIYYLALYQLIGKGHDFMSVQKSFAFSYSNPLIIIEAICLFLVFHSMKFSNKLVNYIASSIFAVYLLHLHPNIKHLYYSYCGQLYNESFMYHFIMLGCLFLCIVFISVFIDKIRLLFFQWLYQKFEHLVQNKWNTNR